MKNTLVLLFLFINLFSVAQIEQIKRIEIPYDDYYGYSVDTIKGKRLLVRSKTEITKNSYQYKFELYGKNLAKIKETTIQFEKNFTKYISDLTDSKYNIVRYYKKKGIAHFHQIDLETLEKSSFNFDIPVKSTLSSLTIFGDYAYFKVSPRKKDGESFIRKIDLKTKKHEDFPYENKYDRENRFYEFEIVGEGDNQELLIVYKYTSGDYRNYGVERFSIDGKRIGRIMNLKFNKHYIQSVSIKKDKTNANRFLVTGAYSIDNDYKPSGIFYAKISETGSIIFERYRLYDDVKNFSVYRTERQKKKLDKLKKKADKKGKEVTLEYRVATHPVFENNGIYYYVGEFYYSTYRTECTSKYTNGTYVTKCRQVFDGYQYSHAVVEAFDKNGKMLWNNTFELWNYYKPYYAKLFMQPIFQINGNIDFMYIDYGRLKSISFDENGEQIGTRKYSYAEGSGDEDDDIKKHSSGSMDFWYDKTVVTHGWQKIKNKEKDKKKREVYYLNLSKYD